MSDVDAGRLVVSGLPGRGLDAATASALEEGRLGGLILFREAFATLEAARELIAAARTLAPWPILVCADEEGGLVSQIDGVPVGSDGRARGVGAPAPAALAALGRPAFTEAAHEVIARELASTGIDVAFAPVLDVAVHPRNPVIGRRAFASDADAVVAHGTAALRGLARGGVMACAKHFPGHGASVADSHRELPLIEGSRAVIDARDLPPFRAAIADGVPLVMVAHAYVPALDAERGPATVSSAIVTALLREGLGFDGVVVSDALEMGGFAGDTTLEERIGRALRAGVNLFVCARDPRLAVEVHAALATLAADDPAARAAIERSLASVDRLVVGRPHAAPATGLGAAVAAAAELLMPLHLRATRVDGALARGPYVAVCPELAHPRHLDPTDVRAGLGAHLGKVALVTYDAERPVPPGALPEMGCVLLVTLARGAAGPPAASRAREAVAAWAAAGTERRVAHLAAGDDDTGEAPGGWTRVLLTGCHRSAFEAAARRLAGEMPPGG